MSRGTRLILSAVLTLSISNPASASKKDRVLVCEQHISDVSKAEGIPLGLLYAVALTESGSNGRLSPYALNIEGVTFVAKTRSDAVAAFDVARKADKKLIDLGCMQINYFYHFAGFQSVEDMLDPKQNITYAAVFLKTLKKQHGSWTNAVARYHAGPKNKIAQQRYVCKVMRNLVSSSFGGWTPEARSHCSPTIKR